MDKTSLYIIGQLYNRTFFPVFSFECYCTYNSRLRGNAFRRLVVNRMGEIRLTQTVKKIIFLVKYCPFLLSKNMVQLA